MKAILHIIDLMSVGGAQTIVKELFENQIDNNDIYVFVLRKSCNSILIQHKNVIISKSKSKYSLKALFELKNIIHQNNVQVLHCHLFKSQVFGWLLKSFFLKNIKLIFHEHGQIWGSETKLKLDDFFFISFLRFAKRQVDRFIAISMATKIKLIERAGVPTKKIDILNNFVNHDKYCKNFSVLKKKAELEKLGYENEMFLVGFAGRIIERKGWQTFIEAAHILRNEPSILFVIAGSGHEVKKMMKMVSDLNLNHKIIYYGFVDNMVNNFYSIIDCLIIPSHWEPMGLVELEAQAMEIPVVVANVSALNEIVEDRVNVLFFESKNAVDLAEKIIELNTHPKIISYLKLNGLANSKKYSIQNYINQLSQLY